MLLKDQQIIKSILLQLYFLFDCFRAWQFLPIIKLYNWFSMKYHQMSRLAKYSINESRDAYFAFSLNPLMKVGPFSGGQDIEGKKSLLINCSKCGLPGWPESEACLQSLSLLLKIPQKDLSDPLRKRNLHLKSKKKKDNYPYDSTSLQSILAFLEMINIMVQHDHTGIIQNSSDATCWTIVCIIDSRWHNFPVYTEKPSIKQTWTMKLKVPHWTLTFC